jgi:hypothetical protein
MVPRLLLNRVGLALMSALSTFSSQSFGSTSSIPTETDSSPYFNVTVIALVGFTASRELVLLGSAEVGFYDDVRHC